MNTAIIPINTQGKQNDLYSSVTLPDMEKAQDCFTRAYKRLQNPRVWHELCGTLSAEFKLFDSSGRPAHRLATVGDRIRIDLPGPGTIAGEGYDWGLISAVDEHINADAYEELVAMQVQPSSMPGGTDGDTAHFFKEGASSTFLIKRSGYTIEASYHGRNEIANTDTSHTLDNIRNTVIAASAKVGLSEAQWSALITAFLQPEIGG